MNYYMYTDVFVDAGDGWRWRFTVTDEAGLFEIRSETWDVETRTWKDEGLATSLHVQAIPLIREALKVLEMRNEITG